MNWLSHDVNLKLGGVCSLCQCTDRTPSGGAPSQTKSSRSARTCPGLSPASPSVPPSAASVEAHSTAALRRSRLAFSGNTLKSDEMKVLYETSREAAMSSRVKVWIVWKVNHINLLQTIITLTWPIEVMLLKVWLWIYCQQRNFSTVGSCNNGSIILLTMFIYFKVAVCSQSVEMPCESNQINNQKRI